MIPLTMLPSDSNSRIKRDRLEILTALVDAPGFDPLFRADVIDIPPLHSVYGWACMVNDCERVRKGRTRFCHGHYDQWAEAGGDRISRAEFLSTARPLRVEDGYATVRCRICPDRPAFVRDLALCRSHYTRWEKHAARADVASDEFAQWVAGETPYPGYGTCRADVCPEMAASPLGLCRAHRERYQTDNRPGGAAVTPGWSTVFTSRGQQVPVQVDDESEFRAWCAKADPVYRAGVVNLLGLPPLLKAEIRWGLHAHAQMEDHSIWRLTNVQGLANYCRHRRLTSLFDLGTAGRGNNNLGSSTWTICREITEGLRCIYYSRQDTKDAGFIETDHFGRRFPNALSTFDLTSVSQRWLRDMLWDYLAETLESPRCPRTRGSFDNTRRAATELSAFLESDAPQGGHDATLLRKEHTQRFVADQRHRERHGQASLGLVRQDGKPSVVTAITRRCVFNSARTLLRHVLESGEAARIGLDSSFILAFPVGGAEIRRSRGPFTDEIAHALGDEANLHRLSQEFDPHDQGLRDIWETIVYTGRRCGEVVKLRLDCIGRYRGLPMLWHDQTKVGNYDEAIRIPEPLYGQLDERRQKTLSRFEQRHARLPTDQERATIALFPRQRTNPREDRSMSCSHFSRTFKSWVETLDLGKVVPHQARHTLATNLLRAGASLTHIRKYLGQVSDRMAEHYVKVAHSDLEDVLHAVWVAGPGAPSPGELLSGESTPLTRGQAMALALDVSRHSTPADGGFCTFQPVVQGGTCPWKLDCENCDKFVLSGADLLYWRRKQEQWRSIAERAPDDATADYLHQVFEPTARAIAGLEKALAGLGLLDEALAMDMRRPQDYFHRIWSTNFRAADLAECADDGAQPELSLEPAE